MERFKNFPFKSPAIALLLSVFLGPVGVLYASIRGGIFLIIVGFVVVSSQFMVPIIILWLISCVWSVSVIEGYNKKLMQQFLDKDIYDKKNNTTPIHNASTLT